jgi:hypothetical protein
MVTLLFTSVIIIGFLAVALYFWQKPAKISYQPSLPPLPNQEGRRGLFSEAETTISATPDRTAVEAETQRNLLVEKARSGDQGALAEAPVLGDKEFYNELLNLLVTAAHSDAALLSLVSYLARNELPVNNNLAQAVLDSWKRAPDRNSTAKALHITALADDAELFGGAVETALQYWRAGKLAGVSGVELQALFDGEYWVLSAHTRSSGAGFVLKRTLADARRGLGNTAGINQ